MNKRHSIIVEVPIGDVVAFENAMRLDGIAVDVAREEQFFGEGQLAIALVEVVPAALNLAAASLGVFAASRSITININGAPLALGGSADKNKVAIETALEPRTEANQT